MWCRASCCALSVLTASVCSAQDITVRVINGADSRPLIRVAVMVSVPFKGFSERRETDASGEAQFKLPEPAPSRIRVDAVLPAEHWDCGCIANATPANVIQNGIVAPPGRKPLTTATSLKPTPGQILFAVRPLSFFERLYMMFSR